MKKEPLETKKMIRDTVDETERCPECNTPLTVTHWGLNVEAVCAGCGYTETNNWRPTQ